MDVGYDWSGRSWELGLVIDDVEGILFSFFIGGYLLFMEL